MRKQESRHHEKQEHHTATDPSHANAYRRLAIMAVASFAAMYLLMYAMVDRLANVVMNYNQVYMAGLMAAPMVLIELVVMKSMYADRRRNTVIWAATVGLGVLCFIAIRQQTGISDRQFARSMIPHHGGAILMCNEARLTSADLRTLCESPEGIVSSQRREIEQLEQFLASTR